MPSNQTANYNLSQWVKSDQVKMEDFNADNAKIDAAIKAVEQKADGLAGSKADTSALTALAQTVAGHTTALDKAGNCQMYTTSYVGTGGYGSSKTCSVTIPFEPRFVFVMTGNNAPLMMANPCTLAVLGSHTINVSWGSRGVTWYSTEGDWVQMNQSSVTYRVVALRAL